MKSAFRSNAECRVREMQKYETMRRGKMERPYTPPDKTNEVISGNEVEVS